MPPKKQKKNPDEDYKPEAKKRGRPRDKVENPDNLTESDKKVSYDQMLLNCIQKEKNRLRQKESRQKRKDGDSKINSRERPEESGLIFSETHSDNDEAVQAELVENPANPELGADGDEQKLDL